jgi:hypothetical protein
MVTPTGRLSTLCLLLMFIGGCATMFSGTKTDIRVESEPSDASVFVDGQQHGKTPRKIRISPQNTREIRVEKDGYGSRTVYMNNQVGAQWVLLDVLFWPALLVDAASGAWYEVEKDRVYVELQKRNAANKSASSDGNTDSSDEANAPVPDVDKGTESPASQSSESAQKDSSDDAEANNQSSGTVRTKKVAVMPIKNMTAKFDTQTLKNGSKYLRSSVAEENRFIVVGEGRQKEQFNKMIKNSKKESYQECYDKSCQIPLGKALAADSIIQSEISYLGTCILNVELVDLAKEASTAGASTSFKCTPMGLKKSIDTVIDKLSAS